MALPNQNILLRLMKFDRYVILFSITLFLSAGLMFALQPMVGKMLLPLVGGAPSGWLVAMTYFQLALLAGYYIAHRLSFLSVRAHGAVVCLLLLAGVFVQPVRMPQDLLSIQEIPEAFRVFLALTIQLTIPFIALSLLSPSLQRLFASSPSSSAKDPYFLFAASNLGSFGGLLLYPLWLERTMGLLAQSKGWLSGYIALVLLCVLCVLAVVRKGAAKKEEIKAHKMTKTDWRTRGWWTLLAFIPSSLMLGVTAHITVDIGAVPFFWVLPLSLYLLTFVLAFARSAGAGTGHLGTWQLMSVALLIFAYVEQPMLITNVRMIEMFLPMAVFVLTALLCHYTLASIRPEPRRLTEFYLFVAAGGALGGIFNTFIAPVLLPLPVEFFLIVLLSCLFFPQPRGWVFAKIPRVIPLSVVLALAGTASLPYVHEHFPSEIVRDVHGAIICFGLLGLVPRPKILAATSITLGLVALFGFSGVKLQAVERNFFGVVRVYDRKMGDETLRVMAHGSTLHGRQKILPEISTMPDTYYHPAGPLGDIMNEYAFRNVGIVGMGTAGIICYQSPGRLYTYYEINEVVPKLAAEWFDFIRACGAPRVVIGDGRKALAAATGAQYDLLIIDAFTSDAIPVHLLTQEAMKEYIDKVSPKGIVAYHISNRFYELHPQLAHQAKSLGLLALYKIYKTPDEQKYGVSTDWVVVNRDVMTLGPLRAKGWGELPMPEARIWTDDYSNLLSALKQVM